VRYLLSLIPDETSNHRIRKVIAQVGSLFDSYGISVKLIKPEKLFVPVLELGSKLPPWRKYFLLKKLNKEIILKFTLKIDRLKLGSANRNRELVSLSLGEGSEELRQIVYKLARVLKIKRSNRYEPNIILGRVTKELTNEEYRNLCTAVSQLNQEILNELNKIEWIVAKINLIEVWPECVISVGEVAV
jgi:hypothetical protein